MPLQPQYVEMPLIKGVDQKTDPKQVPLGKLLIAENVVFQKPGKVQKRNGFSSLGKNIVGGNTLTDGQAIATYNEELLAFDKTNIYSYIDGVDAWNDKGDYVSTYLTSKNVSNSTNRDFSNDSARHSSGLECYVFNREDGNSGVFQIYYTVMDGNTGQTIVAPTLVTNNGIRPKVVAFKNTFVIFYYNTNDTRLYRGVLPIGNLKQAVTFSFITGDSADANSVQDVTYPAYYAAAITTKSFGEHLYLIFNNRTAAGGSTLRRYSSPSSTAPVQTTREQKTHTATIFYDQYYDAPVFAFADGVSNQPSTIWLYIYDPALVDANGDPVVIWWSSTYNTTLDSLFPEPALHLTGVSKSATELKIDLYFDTALFAPYVYLSSFTQANAGGIGPFAFANKNQDFNSNQATPSNGYPLKIPNIGLASQAFSYGGKSYVAVVGGLGISTVGLSYYIINELGQTVAKFYSGLAAGVYQDITTSPLSWWLPSTNMVSDTQYLISAVTKNGFGKIGTKDITGISALTVDFFNEEKSYSRAEIGDNLFIGGGLLFNYDGVSLVEAGFNYAPEIGFISATSGSGNNSYQYRAVYEWVDQRGNLNYSAPSPAYTRVTGNPIGVSGSATTSSIKTLTLTEKTEADGRSPVIIALYRTTAGGQTFYRLPVTTTNQNSTTVPAVAIPDNTTDSALISGRLLYTGGDVLEADQAPPVGALAIYRNRLFVLDSTNPLVVSYSKEVTSGNPVEFNLASTITVDPTGGPCTALAAMDDKLIIFKESSIRYIAGNGPDNTGAGDDYGNAVLITTDAGCTNQRSIVNTPEGLIFKSKKGIYLLNRGLQVSYIGAPVEDYNADFITSAVLLQDRNQVRFTLESTKTLVYDYFVGAWAVFTNLNAVDSVIWKTKHTYIRSNGQPLRETDGVFTDDGSPINLKIQTTWLNFAGIQGFQRWWAGFILGTWKSPHRLLVNLYYDFNENYSQEIVVVPEPLYTYGTGVYGVSGSVYGGLDELYQYRINPERQRCMSAKMMITDIPDVSGSFGAGTEISNLRFEYGAQVNGNRLRTKNQFG